MALSPAHISAIRIPTASSKVYKDECAYSFQNLESEGGLYISLNDFHAVGPKFVRLHYEKTGNGVFLNMRRIKKLQSDESISEEPPKKKPTILGIGVEGGFNSATTKQDYEEHLALYLLPEDKHIPLPDSSLPEKVQQSIKGVLEARSAARAEDVKAWIAEKRIPSKYSATLKQLDNGVRIPPSGWRCGFPNCDKVENLWLNLTDGYIGCGRKNYDGSGGNGHATQHYDETRFPLSVKLGTISAEGETDVYSYPEDDMVEDPLLVQHLLHFGINLAGMKRTEKTMAELELDQNLSFDFSRIQEQGHILEPLYGSGLTGIENLGNSCYLSSVMQMLFSIPSFQQRYYTKVNRDAVFRLSNNLPQDFEAQMVKFGHGLLSGEYATPTGEAKEGGGKESVEPNQVGIAPRMFKALVGAGHPEFATMRQQDALDFFQHILELISRNERARGTSQLDDPVKSFEFLSEERYECPKTHMVRYKHSISNVLPLNIPLDLATNLAEVHAYEERRLSLIGLPAAEQKKEDPVRPHIPLTECLNAYVLPEDVPDFFSSGAQQKLTAKKTTKLATLPDVLVIVAKRFVTGASWEPKKLDVFIDAPEELDLNFLRGNGLQPGEKELPEEETKQQQGPKADEGVVSQLMDMGFPRVRSVKAAIKTHNQGAEQAMNWLIEHMEDADIDVEDIVPAKAAKPAIDESLVENLTSMGFTRGQVMKALSNTDNNVERAADWLFSHSDQLESMDVDSGTNPAASKNPKEGLHDGSGKYKLLGFISHIGSSTTSGHYVCHIKKDDKWVLFNDRKVASSKAPPKEMAYLYFYQRV